MKPVHEGLHFPICRNRSLFLILSTWNPSIYCNIDSVHGMNLIFFFLCNLWACSIMFTLPSPSSIAGFVDCIGSAWGDVVGFGRICMFFAALSCLLHIPCMPSSAVFWCFPSSIYLAFTYHIKCNNLLQDSYSVYVRLTIWALIKLLKWIKVQISLVRWYSVEILNT